MMVGAGQCNRIWKQLGEFPIDVIGNYGMQYAEYRAETKTLEAVTDAQLPCDRESVSRRAEELLSLLAKTGYHMDEYEAEYSEEKRKDAIFYAKDLKDRYTVLWLYDRLLRK